MVLPRNVEKGASNSMKSNERCRRTTGPAVGVYPVLVCCECVVVFAQQRHIL